MRQAACILTLTLLLAGCGGSPNKAQVQQALDSSAMGMMMKSTVDSSKCSKVGKDAYNCVTSIHSPDNPSDAATVTLKMSKVNKTWTVTGGE